MRSVPWAGRQPCRPGQVWKRGSESGINSESRTFEPGGCGGFLRRMPPHMGRRSDRGFDGSWSFQCPVCTLPAREQQVLEGRRPTDHVHRLSRSSSAVGARRRLVRLTLPRVPRRDDGKEKDCGASGDRVSGERKQVRNLSHAHCGTAGLALRIHRSLDPRREKRCCLSQLKCGIDPKQVCPAYRR